MWLFADQYELYDWQLAVAQLDHDDPEMLVASLPDIPSLQSDHQKYEFLVNQLPSLSNQAKDALLKYLLNASAQNFGESVPASSGRMVDRYKQALAELEHQLLQQRSQMKESKWKKWRKEQVQLFKRDFFSDACES